MYIYWTTFDWESWRYFLAATEQGICYISSPNAPFSDLETWAKRLFPTHTFIEASSKLQEDTAMIETYLHGKVKKVSAPLHVIGTTFQRAVWEKMDEVPYGETATYSDIAIQIGNKKAVRAVATAIGKNPLLIILPCHRIIAKSGSLAGFRGGLEMKEKLLALEQNHI